MHFTLLIRKKEKRVYICRLLSITRKQINMKKTFILLLTVLLSTTIFGQKKAKEYTKDINASQLVTDVDSVSYAMGQNMGVEAISFISQMGLIDQEVLENLGDKKNQAILNKLIEGLTNSLYSKNAQDKSYHAGVTLGAGLLKIKETFGDKLVAEKDLNTDLFIQAMTASILKKESLIENPTGYISAKEKEVAELLQQKRIEEGQKFLEANENKEEVHSLPSGVQYKVLVNGSGETPTRSDRVTVHYEGRLLDGTIFDSSYKRGSPATFGVTQVIKGWTEILQFMPAGSKWTVYIPHNMAYGERGAGNIPPYSTLIFDIELIEIAK